MSAHGSWEIEMETPIGTEKALLEFSEHDGALSGQTRDPKCNRLSVDMCRVAQR